MLRLLLSVGLLLSYSVCYAESSQSVPLSELVFYPERSAPAEVIPKHDSMLSVEVNGVIETLDADVGDYVKQGSPLVRLNDYNYRQIVTQVEALLKGLDARIELAQYQLEQAQRLAKQNNISEELQRQRRAELTQLKAERKSQEVELSIAKYNVRVSVLRAPFNGVVVERFAQLGQLADQSVPLFRLVSVENQLVSVDLPQKDALLLKGASDLKLQLGDQLFPLQLQTILPVINNSRRTQQVRLEFVDDAALVGSSGRLVWEDPRPHLPPKYLVQRKGRLGVSMAADQGEQTFVPLPHAQEGRAVQVGHLALDKHILLNNRR